MSLIRFASAYAFRVSGVLIALCFLALSCLAQNGSQGTINVTVVDSTGAVVGGAEVQLKDATTNDTRTAVTGDRGTYTFVNLPIGIYALTVSKTGFDTTSLQSVRASAAQVTDLTVTLKIGVTTQVVEIKGESAPVIETTSSAISTTLDMKQIEDLPIVGRDLTSLSYTVPGYTGAFSGLPSIAEGNNIDGIIGSTSRMKFTGNSQAVVSPRLEDIQEMTVQTDQLDLGSGYGQANMQINYVTRRGGNSYHGRVYEDFRNAALDANTWTNNATLQPKNPLILNDFGGSVGGPIIKNKLFFFGSFSMSKQPGGYTSTNWLMAPATQGGNFTFTGTDGAAHTVNVLQIAKGANPALPGTVNPTVATQLQAINGATQFGTVSSNGDANLQTLQWLQGSPITYYYPTVRVDYNISQKFRVNFAWNETKYHQPGAAASFLPGPDFSKEAASNTSRNYTASLGFDWTITPTLINQFHGGMLYNYSGFSYDAPKTYVTGSIVNWNFFNAPFPYAGNMSAQQFNLPISTYYPLINASDTVSWQHGAHTFNFGFSFYREQDHYWNAPAGIPSFNLGLATGDPAINAFTSSPSMASAPSAALSEAEQLYAILTGRISSVAGQFAYNTKTGQYLNGTGAYNLDELSKAWGLFFQDSYRIKPTLTFNYGLRWDFTGDNHDLTGAYHSATPADVFGPSGVGNLFNPGVLNGINDPVLASREHPYAPWNVSPQPAVGIAWNPTAKDGWLGKLTGGGQTVIRAGFSLRRFTEPYQYFWDDASDYGSFFYQNFNLNASNTTAAGTFAPGSLSLGNTLPAYQLSPIAFEKIASQSEFTFLNSVPTNGMDPHIQQPYTQSWNLGIQRSLGRNSAIEVRYVGSRTVHQWVSTDVNEVNIFAARPGQPSFLQQFTSAQSNLKICMSNPTCAANPSFGNSGLPGQTTLPIFDAAFKGEAGGPGTFADYTNGQFITALNNGAAGSLASTLTTTSGTTNYFCNLVGASFTPCVTNVGFPANDPGAGYPINFFQANPYGSGGQVGLGAGFTGGYMTAAGYSNYNGLLVDFRQRTWHGLQFDANYTWSHTLGTATANQWQGVINQFTARDLRLSYGPTLFDLRHVVHVNATYDMPFGKGRQFLDKSGPLDKVVGGWTIGTIATLHTGYPFQLLGGFNTFNDYGDGGVALHNVTVSQLQSSVGVYPATCSGSGCTTGYVNFINPKYLASSAGGGANSSFILPNTTPGTIGATPYLYGPHFANFDIAITKSVSITERIKFRFQSEFLNAFNHPNFGSYPPPPNQTIQNSSFGQVGQFSNPANLNQISLARIIELRANIDF